MLSGFFISDDKTFAGRLDSKIVRLLNVSDKLKAAVSLQCISIAFVAGDELVSLSTFEARCGANLHDSPDVVGSTLQVVGGVAFSIGRPIGIRAPCLLGGSIGGADGIEAVGIAGDDLCLPVVAVLRAATDVLGVRCCIGGVSELSTLPSNGFVATAYGSFL